MEAALALAPSLLDVEGEREHTSTRDRRAADVRLGERASTSSRPRGDGGLTRPRSSDRHDDALDEDALPHASTLPSCSSRGTWIGSPAKFVASDAGDAPRDPSSSRRTARPKLVLALGLLAHGHGRQPAVRPDTKRVDADGGDDDDERERRPAQQEQIRDLDLVGNLSCPHGPRKVTSFGFVHAAGFVSSHELLISRGDGHLELRDAQSGSLLTLLGDEASFALAGIAMDDQGVAVGRDAPETEDDFAGASIVRDAAGRSWALGQHAIQELRRGSQRILFGSRGSQTTDSAISPDG